jgi:prephenate dehydrogenase
MGGAVGLAARKSGAALRVIGVTGQTETLDKARTMGVVDEATLDLRLGVQDADLVVLSLPVRLIPSVAQSVLQAGRSGTVITDVGSTKALVVAAVEELIARQKAPLAFVGSHPLAGSEKTGIEAAGEVQLAGAHCILTPTPATDNDAYQRVDEFWKTLGMKTLRLAPAEHDVVLARSSHLPHLLAYALVMAQTDRSLNLSGTGLRDMTRLAGSDVALWTDILAQNAGELSRFVKDFGNEMLHLAQELEALALAGTPGAEAARERVFRYLADAKQRRDKRFPPESRSSSATVVMNRSSVPGSNDVVR